MGRGRTTSWELGEAKIISREQAGAVLAAAKRENRTDYLLLAVAANVAIRVSEIVHLRVDNVSSERSVLLVVRRKKNKLKPEPIPVSKELHALLSARARDIGKGWLWPGASTACYRDRVEKGKVVAREKLCSGGHLSTREAQRRWDHYAEKAGIAREGRGIHSLRHYGITEFHRTNKDIRATQVFAGHSSILTTTVYAHVVDLDERVGKVKPTL